jgi:hypothetical protein
MISPRNRTRLQQPIGRSGVERRALRHIGGGERRGAAEDGLALLQPARVRGGRGRGYKYQPAPPRTYTAGADFSPARRRKKPGHRRRNKTRRRHRDRSRKVRRPFARSLPCARGGSSIDDFRRVLFVSGQILLLFPHWNEGCCFRILLGFDAFVYMIFDRVALIFTNCIVAHDKPDRSPF